MCGTEENRERTPGDGDSFGTLFHFKALAMLLIIRTISGEMKCV
jgi:hypothetical protein